MTPEARFEQLLEQLATHAGLSPIGAGILSALHTGLAENSRSFASKLGLAHALVLRECVALAEEAGLIIAEDRGERSQRLHLSLTASGEALLARAHRP